MRLSERLRFNVENLAFQQEQAEITAMAASLAQIVGMVKFFKLACLQYALLKFVAEVSRILILMEESTIGLKMNDTMIC